MDSMPPATTHCSSPALIAWAASITALRPEPQTLLTVSEGIDEQCVVAGGMESMSNAPHYVYGMRGGIKAGNSQLVDGMIHDGLWDSFSNTHMGNLAEYTAKKAGVSRTDQDAFALASHHKAVAAMAACRFKAE